VQYIHEARARDSLATGRVNKLDWISSNSTRSTIRSAGLSHLRYDYLLEYLANVNYITVQYTKKKDFTEISKN